MCGLLDQEYLDFLIDDFNLVTPILYTSYADSVQQYKNNPLANICPNFDLESN